VFTRGTQGRATHLGLAGPQGELREQDVEERADLELERQHVEHLNKVGIHLGLADDVAPHVQEERRREVGPHVGVPGPLVPRRLGLDQALQGEELLPQRQRVLRAELSPQQQQQRLEHVHAGQSVGGLQRAVEPRIHGLDQLHRRRQRLEQVVRAHQELLPHPLPDQRLERHEGVCDNHGMGGKGGQSHSGPRVTGRAAPERIHAGPGAPP